jgi:hypothetical protein
LIDAAEVVRRIKLGEKIDSHTMTEVRDTLRTNASRDVHHLARALALGAEPTESDIELLEGLLRLDLDSWSLQGVVYALCSYWQLTSRCLPFLCKLTEKEHWPGHHDAAAAAFASLGDHAHACGSHDVIAHLLNVYDEEIALYRTSDDSFDFEHLMACYSALAVAVKGPRARIGLLKIKRASDLSEEIVASARQMARRK